jgi:hypothetical protein
MSHSISYTFYTRSTAYKKQEAPDQRPVLCLILFTCATPCTKSTELSFDVPFYLLYFLHVQRYRQKVKGSRSISHSISYTFYMRSTTYKKEGALNRCPILSLILFTRAVPHTKKKRLLIRTSSYFSYTTIIGVWKARGISLSLYIYICIYISMAQVLSKTIFIQVYKYTKVYCSLQKKFIPG